MLESTYNKLVRDRIPEIIEKEGRFPLTSEVPERERVYHLYRKLLEETHEAIRSADKEGFLNEAADLVEVLHALASAHGLSWDRIEAERTTRKEELGGFSGGVFLHAVQPTKSSGRSHIDELASPCLLTSSSSTSLLDVLRRELQDSSACRIATAFYSRGMLNQLMRPLEGFLERGGELKLLTSVMNSFNNPDDLVHLRRELPQCEIRIFYPGEGAGEERFAKSPAPFHVKSYLFDKPGNRPSLIVGSSNLTLGGLAGNEEWNLYSNSEVNLPFTRNDARSIYETARDEFEQYWSQDSVDLTPAFLDWYRPRWKRMRTTRKVLREQIEAKSNTALHPRPAQKKALDSLATRRRLGVSKSAVIAATGLGKTHLAAFDFQQSGMRNVLFIAHRETILREAREVFRRVLKLPEFGEVLSGRARAATREAAQQSCSDVFAMIQTLSRPEVLEDYAVDHFDYIVVDEFHHSEAASYQAALRHFEPRFFLGVTATPERMDGRDVLRLCDYNIAYEARLFDAIDQGWLVPFQYFAIHDETDYAPIRWTGTGYDDAQLERELSTDTRAELVTRNLKRFLPASGKIKALAFCATKGHARYMTDQFKERGLEAICLLGESSEMERAEGIDRLQNETDPLQIICTVDIFSEGVDVPAVSHVLLLRPTKSFTVFLQQLGRGLRKIPDKDYLVALDFVGNYRNSYIAPLVLRGFSSVEEYRSRNRKDNEFRLPRCCTIDADTQVQRIWDKEIRRAVAPRNRKDVLKETYRVMRDDLGRVPSLLDFLANPDACDPHAFVKYFGNWLRTKQEMNDLTPYERGLLDTPGEVLLQHVEKGLNPNRSYKMVVLLALLQDEAEATQWNIEWIAQRFREHYLDHFEQLGDCSVLGEAEDPETVPIRKIESLLKSMPLRYLSNTADDFFTLDGKSGIFRVKSDVCSFWQDPQFRDLLRERSTYSLMRYFQAKGVDLGKYAFNVDAFVRQRAEANVVDEDKVEVEAETISLPFYPALRVAAGIFREPTADYECSWIDVPVDLGHLSADHHFVVRIEGDSMDAGNTPIHDGDIVLMERLNSSRAGSLTAERAIAVEYRDRTGDTSYALKQIRKDPKGGYWLHSWNGDYEDVKVDEDATFPMARFLRRLELDE